MRIEQITQLGHQFQQQQIGEKGIKMEEDDDDGEEEMIVVDDEMPTQRV